MNKFCVCAVVLMCNANLFAAEKIRVAVLDMQAKNASKDLALAVTDLIRIELLKYDVYEMLDRDNMNIILKEQAFQQSGCTSAECAVEIGQILNCQYMFVGALSKIGESFYISMQRVNVETGRVDFADNREVEKENVLPKAARDLAGQMAAGKVRKKKLWREASRSWRIELGAAWLSFGEQVFLVDGIERGGEQVAVASGPVIGFRYCPGWRSRFTFGANITLAMSREAMSEFIVDNVSYESDNYKVSYRGMLYEFIFGIEGRLYYDISDRIGLAPHTLKLMGGLGMTDGKIEFETVAVNLTPSEGESEDREGESGGHVTTVFETLGVALSWWKLELLMAMRFHNDEMIVETDRFSDDNYDDPNAPDFPVPPRKLVLAERSTALALMFLF